jgi:hypothetical protein
MPARCAAFLSRRRRSVLLGAVAAMLVLMAGSAVSPLCRGSI